MDEQEVQKLLKNRKKLNHRLIKDVHRIISKDDPNLKVYEKGCFRAYSTSRDGKSYRTWVTIPTELNIWYSKVSSGREDKDFLINRFNTIQPFSKYNTEVALIVVSKFYRDTISSK